VLEPKIEKPEKNKTIINNLEIDFLISIAYSENINYQCFEDALSA
jgi:hypothetical protein